MDKPTDNNVVPLKPTSPGKHAAPDTGPSESQPLEGEYIPHRELFTRLTPRQEKFAQCIAQGMSQIEAYKQAYDASNSTDKSCYEIASRLMANVKIRSRVDSLHAGVIEDAAERIDYAVQEAMQDLDDAIAFALACKNPNAVVAALNLKQKINGLHVEDRKNERSPVAGLDAATIRSAIAAIGAIKKAATV